MTVFLAPYGGFTTNLEDAEHFDSYREAAAVATAQPRRTIVRVYNARSVGRFFAVTFPSIVPAEVL